MSLKKINIVVAGATGYVGLDLIKILSSHPRASIKYLCAQKNIGKNIQFFDKRIKKKLPKISNLKSVNWNKIDVLFCSLPTGASQILAKKLIKKFNLKIIDLSADFRLTNKKDFYKFYKIKHFAPELLKFSKYSLTEFVKKDLKKFKIIACPGCYPTSIQLPMLPLLKKKLLSTKGIIIDSKSGYSGAGKNLKKKFKHKNIFSAIKAYGISNHRHTAEIDQEFKKATKSKIYYNFTPHLIPTFRGMLSTIYVEPNRNVTINKIHNELINFHKKNNFVKILPINKNLGTENVINTNLCEISVCKLKGSKKIMILSAIDNLIKGASGQAVQNMNIIYNLNEKIGLK
tara:strand:- start:816 stop:1847 length:1032 start_codon:yes stop_codon:yes gene_type:complete